MTDLTQAKEALRDEWLSQPISPADFQKWSIDKMATLLIQRNELLEALKMADERLLLGKPYTGGDDEGFHQIRAAIAKAEGK